MNRTVINDKFVSLSIVALWLQHAEKTTCLGQKF